MQIEAMERLLLAISCGEIAVIGMTILAGLYPDPRFSSVALLTVCPWWGLRLLGPGMLIGWFVTGVFTAVIMMEGDSSV